MGCGEAIRGGRKSRQEADDRWTDGANKALGVWTRGVKS